MIRFLFSCDGLQNVWPLRQLDGDQVVQYFQILLTGFKEWELSESESRGNCFRPRCNNKEIVALKRTLELEFMIKSHVKEVVCCK